MVKRVSNVLLATKVLKPLDIYAYFFQKLVHIEETFIKLKYILEVLYMEYNDFYETFLIKDDELLEKYNEIWEKVKKKNLIVNLYTMKNI